MLTCSIGSLCGFSYGCVFLIGSDPLGPADQNKQDAEHKHQNAIPAKRDDGQRGHTRKSCRGQNLTRPGAHAVSGGGEQIQNAGGADAGNAELVGDILCDGTGGNNGNGVVGYIDEIDNEKPFPAGAMSLALGGSFLGSCFIQKKPFYTAQNVAVLQEKTLLSDFIKLFIATLIRNECKIKYQAFGRELNAHFKKDFTIKLPVKRDSRGYIIDDEYTFSDEGYIPDWDWMDRYMRALPYSDRI